MWEPGSRISGWKSIIWVLGVFVFSSVSYAEESGLSEREERVSSMLNNLEHARASLHEAHKELGVKAERILELEAALEDPKNREKAGVDTRSLLEKERQLNAGLRKRLAAYEAQIIAMKAQQEKGVVRDAQKMIRERLPLVESTYFDEKSAANYEDWVRVARDVKSVLKNHPMAEFRLIGYANDSEWDQTNQDISENRASFLASYLAANGIPSQKLHPKGVGKCDELAKMGRRVDFEVFIPTS